MEPLLAGATLGSTGTTDFRFNVRQKGYLKSKGKG